MNLGSKTGKLLRIVGCDVMWKGPICRKWWRYCGLNDLSALLSRETYYHFYSKFACK